MLLKSHFRMNCLITSIGSFSGEAVISSLRKNNISKITGCDIHPSAWLPASSSVDSFYQVPKAFENDLYLQKLNEIILKEEIYYIVPLTDPEVDIFSKNRSIINKHNVTICIPNNITVNICRNKLAFYDFFRSDQIVDLIPTYEPASFPLNVFNYPIIAKPQNGRSSEGVIIIKSESEFKFVTRRLSKYVLQPFIHGDIFTVDLVRNEKTAKSVAMSRKELIRTKNGAGLTVEISMNEELCSIAKYIGEKLQLNGCINMEFIATKKKYYLMDINPRFSAGVSFSILAGYDMVMNHLNCFMGEDIQDAVIYKTMIIAKKLTDVVTIGDL